MTVLRSEKLNELQAQVVAVVNARRTADVAKEVKSASYAAWQEDNKELIETASDLSQQVVEAESRLRELTIEAYKETGDKTPADGVGIREVMVLEYDPDKAFGWAVEHKLAPKLDISTFEGIAKKSPPEFVKIDKVPQATISTKLGREQ